MAWLAVDFRHCNSSYFSELGVVEWYKPSDIASLDFHIKKLESRWKITKIVLDFEFGRYIKENLNVNLLAASTEQHVADVDIQLPVVTRFGQHAFDTELVGSREYRGGWVEDSLRFSGFDMRIHPTPEFWIFLSCSYDPRDQWVVDLATHYAHVCGLGVLQARDFEEPRDTRRKVELLIEGTDATVVLQTPRYTVDGQITSPWIIWEHGIAFSKRKLELSLADEDVDLSKQGPLADFQPTLRFRRDDVENVHRCFSAAFAWLRDKLRSRS